MHILVFKTNIASDDAHKIIGTVLDPHPQIVNWTIDKDDVDKVLRIESKTNNASEIISNISRLGFFCEELPD